MKIMGKPEQNICSYPKCNKQVFEPNMRLCGEHQRDFKQAIDFAKKRLSPLIAVGAFHIVKKGITKFK